jgi:hypothetical protein
MPRRPQSGRLRPRWPPSRRVSQPLRVAGCPARTPAAPSTCSLSTFERASSAYLTSSQISFLARRFRGDAVVPIYHRSQLPS